MNTKPQTSRRTFPESALWITLAILWIPTTALGLAFNTLHEIWPTDLQVTTFVVLPLWLILRIIAWSLPARAAAPGLAKQVLHEAHRWRKSH